MNKNEDIVNNVLVNLFNGILFTEEKNLKQKLGNTLSMKDIHILSAIDKCKTDATAGNVAKNLNITLGTLTTAIDKLVDKGYVIRQKGAQDRRKIYLVLTDEGRRVNSVHENFHKGMAEEVLKELTANEQEILIETLKKIEHIFELKD